ncbi:hypothetical protein [Gelidibacter salicanalis]|uniref:Uncharacterized protein n=1 Tax=Gelidibacter salicanalis TaxID=291193 RepID=A0A934NIJ8_9FLAO|nr:hypothetical protein [Gelidibacter salicanalis]MBJ7881248.1 hypothetical protein [Gelidibacter salicanalis]
MKKIMSFIFLLSLTFSAFATEQEMDLLIVENDTIYLKTSLLEKLELETPPFGNTRERAPSTGCWRGYRAIWKIIDNKLYLEKIIRCNSDRGKGEQDLIELFKANGFDFKENNGMILADWVTEDFYKMNFSSSNYYKDKIYLYDGWNEKEKNKDKNLKLKIKSGEIKLNRLKE